MSDEQLTTLMARLAMLDMQVQAQGRVLMALALATPVARRGALLEMLTAVSLNAAVTEGVNVSRQMTGFSEEFLALTAPNTGASAAHVKVTLALQTALLASAPPDQQAAMQHWLSIASPAEIADEARELLRSLPPRPAAPGRRGKRGAGGSS